VPKTEMFFFFCSTRSIVGCFADQNCDLQAVRAGIDCPTNNNTGPPGIGALNCDRDGNIEVLYVCVSVVVCFLKKVYIYLYLLLKKI
jgi:hypothetical protein